MSNDSKLDHRRRVGSVACKGEKKECEEGGLTWNDSQDRIRNIRNLKFTILRLQIVHQLSSSSANHEAYRKVQVSLPRHDECSRLDRTQRIPVILVRRSAVLRIGGIGSIWRCGDVGIHPGVQVVDEIVGIPFRTILSESFAIELRFDSLLSVARGPKSG